MSNLQLAIKEDAEFMQTWNTMRSSWYELGRHFFAIEEKELWRCLAYSRDHVDDDGVLVHTRGDIFRTIDSWLKDRILDASRSTAYAALQAYKDLKDIPAVELKKIQITNAKVLREMPEKDRIDPKWVKAGQDLSERQLVDKIRKERPELHIERKHSMKLKFQEGGKGEVDLAIKAMAWISEKEGREGNLELICADWLNQMCEVAGFAGLSNREAYEKAHAKTKGASA